MASVHDVASHITDYFDGPISTMKLQKLCYFAQGWSLALAKRPMFEEDFQAWRNGPVCYELFNDHRGEYSVSDWARGDSGNLDDRDRVIIDAVMGNYGALSGLQLSEMTHEQNTPWSAVRAAEGASRVSSSSTVIDKNSIRDYFAALLGVSAQAATR